MLTALKSLDSRLLSAFLRVIDGLCDPARRNRVALHAAIAYGAIWTIYAIVAKSTQGVHPDMAEMMVWAHNPAWGYPKHPPFPTWILYGWFTVFPQADWAYYLLAVTNLAAGLYLSFLLAGLWLDGEKRAVAPFLLALIPFYNFIGLKFDHNAFLISLWALTIWAFVQSFRRQHLGYAALAGVAAAAALLTKYWSVFLLFAICIAALNKSGRGTYWRSAAPWVTVLVGMALIAPHAVWLVQENFPPAHSITTRRTAQVLADWLSALSEYCFGTLGYSSLAVMSVVVLARPSLAAWRDSFFPRESARRMAGIIFWLPLLAPIAVAIATRTTLLSLWNMGAIALLPVMLLSSPLITVSRIVAARIAAFATVVSVGALVASPFVAATKLRSGVENNALYVHAAAVAVEEAWTAASNRPLKVIAGPYGLVSSVAFLLKDKPSTFADFSPYLSPWVDAQKLKSAGVAVICPSRDTDCARSAALLAAQRPSAQQVEVELTPRWLGLSGMPDRFLITVVPPL